jgi:uncharacterized protein
MTKDTKARDIATGSEAVSIIIIAGQKFTLEVAADEAAHAKGLAGRTCVSERGGMLFVFETASYQSFSMRDCSIPLDLLYLDDAGKVLSTHEMHPEPPRATHEVESDEKSNAAYMARLKGYISTSPAKFAIELRGGSIRSLGVREGDSVGIDVAAVERLAALDAHAGRPKKGPRESIR